MTSSLELTIRDIAREVGVIDYGVALSEIIGEDYSIYPICQWGDRARAHGYTVNDYDDARDAIQSLFEQYKAKICVCGGVREQG